MSSSERLAKKPKFAQPILTHFFEAQASQSSLTSPDCDLDSQSPERLNEFLTLSQQEYAEPQQITPQPSIQKDFNPYLVDKETHCHGNQKFNKAWLAEIPWLRYDASLDLLTCYQRMRTNTGLQRTVLSLDGYLAR